MAITRFGHLDDFTQKNNKVGIGTSTPQDKMEVIGGTRSTDLRVAGIATLTSAGGFIEKHIGYVEDQIIIDAGDSGTLSGEIVVGSGQTITVGTAATASQGTVDALKVYDMFQPPSGGTNQRPPAKPGAIFYNFDFKTIEFFDGNSWRQVDNTTVAGRAVFTSGPLTPSSDFSSVIDKVNISSIGNATSFGNQTAVQQTSMAIGNETRGIFQQGGSSSNTLEYITIPSDGNSIDYGDLSAARYAGSGANSSTRGLFMGGAPGPSNVIDYVEISTIGNALDFGDLFTGAYLSSGANSPIKAFKVAGYVSANSTAIQVVTMSSKGNATDFGDTDRPNSTQGGFSNSIRGIYGGGNLRVSPTSHKQIYMFNLNSQGSAIFFGDLAAGRYEMKGACSQTRGLFAGGYGNPASLNTIEFITIASTGNARDFGDLTRGARNFGATSDSHGGLGGF